MAVTPGVPGSGRLMDVPEPVGAGDILVEGLAVGICGTDAEIAAGDYGTPPPGDDHLVLGHESLGRVVDAPPASGLRTGDLVVGIVRRPDPDPCRPCSLGAWDMCRNGRYTERGIKELHGFGATRWRTDAEYAVRVDVDLGDLGVLVEPASIVAKAWQHLDAIAGRAPIFPGRVLVTGAGPIGLLAALLAIQRELEVHVLDRATSGPKPDLVRDLGATYHVGSLASVPEPDIVVECTGADVVIADVLHRTAPAGLVCLTGVSSGGRTLPLDVGSLNRELVLENDVIFGSVNANARHYALAVDALGRADRRWLGRLITRQVPLASWTEALERGPDDVKVVVTLA
ncbi:MAG TPA: glucose 1-dehydrogenase [Acidimicrobiales bacterium]|nr:glucose 1-dehydrogenase [Acidimicrobiales bacterium]